MFKDNNKNEISIVLLVDAMMIARKNPEFFKHSDITMADGTRVETAYFGKYSDMSLTIVSGRPTSPTTIECKTMISGKPDDAQEHREAIEYSIRAMKTREEWHALVNQDSMPFFAPSHEGA